MQTRATKMVGVTNIVTRVLHALLFVFTLYEDQTVVTGRRGGGRSSRSYRYSRSGSRSGGFGSGGSGNLTVMWVVLGCLGGGVFLALICYYCYHAYPTESENASDPLCKPADGAGGENPVENKPGGYHPGQSSPYQ